ncbi:DNA polymerase III subunit gamma/tau [Insolitispirillum peregrinum]|uniref:DNA polymerase III subunit gamma/tau n=1 Tax=Insolitispirillum peregrinum TaxID=80876 RepID=A0A1N7JCL1_9PROT|nr:DNA polymerase III subunit gamma/tau [Insolitispirillum peregrinum]SIS47045.1 DNA polymerase-3 subunit gamma/tau [Insolitispirillum peregrinum]
MSDQTEPSSVATSEAAYRVLARKYRPADFSTLIGQQALVRTLSNAIRTGRLAQAYVLTGVRGVGKTTTARIIARCLNCIGLDGTGGPTVEPCGQCEHCRAIAEDRHVDVFEMDAASRTGVGDIRELIEGVRYRPTSARYKIYIIDEVHMLSTGAFNALLKTLEEPPEHVKFIFATTEIRKVPVTVLSRCQRFDLRRVTAETLADHFTRIAAAEQARIEDGALRLVARAADGSVRDGLSLLDQAIAQAGAGAGGDGMVTEQQVRDMLGLADRAVVFDLFDAVMRGDIQTALTLLNDQYAAGADPVVVLNDMLELTHWLTRLKVTPASADDPMAAETERVRGKDMAGRLAVPVLTRTWQMLLKGISEARSASSTLQATEMCLIRLSYAADLPSPVEALAKLQAAGGPAGNPPLAGGAPNRPSPSPASPTVPTSSPAPVPAPVEPPAPVPVRPPVPSVPPAPVPPVSAPAPAHEVPPWATEELPPADLAPPPVERSVAPPPPPARPAPQPAPDGGGDVLPVPASFDRVVALFRQKREAVLQVHLERDVHLVRYDGRACRIDLRLTPKIPRDFTLQVSKLLSQWTGRPWTISGSEQAGEATLFEQTMTGARANPLVQKILEAFPKASIGLVRDLEEKPLFEALPPAPPETYDPEDGPDAGDPDLLLDFGFHSME